MTEELLSGQIKRLQRAIFAQLSPLTGSRASGAARVVALNGGGDITLPVNTYLIPAVDGESRDSRLYKVAPNPDTITAGSVASGQWSGGEWVIPEGDELQVTIQSNIGGAHQNLPAGTRLRFDPPVAGLEADALVETAITNGTNTSPLVGSAKLVRLVFWQELRAAQSAREFFAAGAGEFPAMLMIWLRSQTLQGRTSGGTQGNTRIGRGERAFRESFQCFFGAGSHGSADQRRDQGMIALELATALLSDQQNNVDMEPICSMGAGVEIVERALAVAKREHFIYSMDFEVNQVVSKLERRVFGPWEVNHIVEKLPGREAPEPTTPLTIADTEDDMPDDE
jgi:hypothetical protein